MPNSAQESIVYPFTNFNFSVEITRAGPAARLVSAAFAECDGLDMTQDVKTIREGGNNGQQIRLTGPTSFGLLTLKRGMTSNFDLWQWLPRSCKSQGCAPTSTSCFSRPTAKTCAPGSS